MNLPGMISASAHPSAGIRFLVADCLKHFLDSRYMVCDSSIHRGSDAQALVNPQEVVMHEVNRNRVEVVLDFLTEAVRQAREPAHLHSHGEVLALDVAR